MNELNKKQRTFAEAYAIPGTECYGNATKSAIKAGYSEKTARSQGQRLLTDDDIKNYIKGVEQQLFDENIMSGKEVLYRLTKTARGEHTEIEAIVTKTGDYKENPDTGRMQLVYDEEVQLVSKPPKISDQNKALELLGKHHKLFIDKQEVEHKLPMFVENIPEED
ncbi:TPA: terminase small subunit [Staphylococcus pseudintermedius]|uniref:terminase small subunit n=1 Tax=Staphylococcus pseudintermedius TaxID=283734 RepID=UPI0014414598|nr:terminase small subunit [Staphylococcus pseudintermedius]EGQ2829494.1 terminase small subunit [Staphylococcus pseudintermedius]EGQ2850741.1 terminase small subunit [Staphylococcus pseudintermedius]EGQ3094346.1 terminase small subunit [Staphylococcus pseudintermedius]EGQ3156006.1 terminase small subunit [Staphylococcus pseudintermedius]EGQ3487589.1 terminase small subunit [Staphylococcus pseudintermedius]